MGRASTLAVALVVIILVFTFLSRVPSVPLGYFVIASRSMEPSIKVADIVVIMGREAQPGDIVTWCLGPYYCIVHRLVNITDSNLVTKGDANPIEDHPVPISYLKGKVVLRVPREFWIPIFLVASGVTLFTTRPKPRRTFNVLATLVLVGYVIASAIIIHAALTAIPTYAMTQFEAPIFHLSKVSFDKETCELDIYYVGNGDLYLKEVKVLLDGNETLFNFNETHIKTYLPKDIIGHYAIDDRSIKVDVIANMTRKAKLMGTYEVRVPYQSLTVDIEDGRVLLTNPNCYPVKVNVTYYYAMKAGDPWSTLSEEITVEKSLELIPPQANYVYIEVQYRLGGRDWYMKLRVR